MRQSNNMTRNQWLADKLLEYSDVMIDSLGREYVYDIDEEGIRQRVFLPEFDE